MLGKKEVPASLSHWAFGQVCAEVGAPAGYVRGLPATLALARRLGAKPGGYCYNAANQRLLRSV